MPERSAYLEGSNLGMAVAIGVAIAAGSVAVFGPARTVVERIQTETADASVQLETWEREYARFVPVSEPQRSSWRASWLGLVARLRPARGDAELMALIGEGLNAGSARGLQVVRLQSEATGEESEPGELLVPPIGDGVPLQAKAERVRATLTASYDDVRQIIERFETRQLPARLDSIELKRDYPDVSMQLELVYFVRREVE